MVRIKKEPDDRREDILVETLRQIELNGIDRVRAVDISKALGVSSGLIFYHFGSLRQLILESIRYATEREVSLLEQSKEGDGIDVTERLLAALKQYGPTDSAFGWRLWIECWSASLRDSELRKMLDNLDQSWRSVIASLVEKGVLTGVFECEDPIGAAWRICSLLDGLSIQNVVFEGRVSHADIDHWMKVVIRQELGV